MDRTLLGLLPADMYATSPRDPLGKVASGFLNAETLHWGMIVRPIPTDEGTDYEVVEALLTKGTSVGLFNKIYADIPLRIYRVTAVPTPDPSLVEKVAYSYGRAFYGYLSIPGIVAWHLSFHLGRILALQPPALSPDAVICTVLVTLIWRDLGVELVPGNAYPTPNMLEASPYLECIYAEF